jgi:hypothetical protein
MSLYLYCSYPSNGARELAERIDAGRIRQWDGIDFWRKGKRVKFKDEDTIICWGNRVAEMDGVRVINGADPGSKLKAARTLQENSIRTIQFRGQPSIMDGFIGRLNNHVGGNDLLNPPARPDFWVLKEDFVKEYRIHSFAGRSIRAGRRVPREGFAKPHKWIRTYDAGWKILYDQFEATKKMRSRANQAVKLLGLTFGAVDLGELEDGTLVVLEVNKAPGLEGNTIEAYGKAIEKFLEGEKEEKDDDA